MDPAGSPAHFARLHPVVANVDHAIALGFQAPEDSLRDQLAIRRRPVPGVIVADQIVSGFVASYCNTAEPGLRHVFAQDRFAEPAGAAVDA